MVIAVRLGLTILALGFGTASAASQSLPVIITKPYCDTSCEVQNYVDAVDRDNARRRGVRKAPVNKALPRVLAPKIPVGAARRLTGWTIKKLPDEDTCLMTGTFEGGTIFALQFSPDDGSYFTLLSNPKWRP